MLRRDAINLEKGSSFQYFIGFLCLTVYAGSLFFPLMDKDAAHHANIALHMLEHNDYVSLVDRGMDYLDKPHFLFWSSAASFKIFGINSFAHRLPAVIFALITIYSTYKLALHLSDRTTAKLAALMLGTAQGFMLSITDARMETPLSAAIIFGLWQLIMYIDARKLINILLAALGAAVAFSTKGWIGPVIIFLATFFYLLLTGKWRVLLAYKTWLFIPFFGLFISPVLYAYYLQFDLHPEKVIRGMSRISGVKFILWDQNFERFSGDSFKKGGRNSSVFFLYHTFIWAFFPWCIAAYAALFYWLKRMFYQRKWRYPFNFAVLAFASVLFTISFSKFKMPHYIFMLLPLAALFTAPYLRWVLSARPGIRFFYPLQVSFAVLVIAAIILLNFYFFQPLNRLVWIFGSALLLGLLILLLRKQVDRGIKAIYLGIGFMLVFNFFLNYNFFPNLLKYQGGNELVHTMQENKIEVADDKIDLLDPNAHSFDFYRNYNHPIVEVGDLISGKQLSDGRYYLLTTGIANDLRKQGFVIEKKASHVDYNVATMKLKFLNPSTRSGKLDTLMLARIYR